MTKNLLARRRDGANPWAVVTTDAYGRTTNIIEVVGGSNFSTVFKHTIIGDLTNTTDNAGNVTQYDDLHRLTNYVHNGTTYKFGYNSIGNITNNGEFGTGLYTYGAQPHAVTNANSKSYKYDACGNMTNLAAYLVEEWPQKGTRRHKNQQALFVAFRASSWPTLRSVVLPRADS